MSKYGAKEAAGVVVSETASMTDLLVLTLAVTVRVRVQLASLRTRATMSEQVAAIRRDLGYTVGEERGA